MPPSCELYDTNRVFNNYSKINVSSYLYFSIILTFLLENNIEYL